MCLKWPIILIGGVRSGPGRGSSAIIWQISQLSVFDVPPPVVPNKRLTVCGRISLMFTKGSYENERPDAELKTYMCEITTCSKISETFAELMQKVCPVTSVQRRSYSLDGGSVFGSKTARLPPRGEDEQSPHGGQEGKSSCGRERAAFLSPSCSLWSGPRRVLSHLKSNVFGATTNLCREQVNNGSPLRRMLTNKITHQPLCLWLKLT